MTLRRLLGSLAGTGAALQRRERCTAAVLRSRPMSQVGRSGQEPSCWEQDGGGWRRRRWLGWPPGQQDRTPAQALAQKLEAEGIVRGPGSRLEPSRLRSLNLPLGGRQESNTAPQHLQGVPHIPLPIRPPRGGSPVQSPTSLTTAGQCLQGDGSAVSPAATLLHL